MESEGKEQSEFNMAVSYLARLNALFYGADEASIKLDMYAWFHILASLYRELSTEINAKDQAEFENRLNELNTILSKIYNKNTGKMKIESEHYFKFHKFEIDLRKVTKESGLQMKMQKDRSFGV